MPPRVVRSPEVAIPHTRPPQRTHPIRLWVGRQRPPQLDRPDRPVLVQPDASPGEFHDVPQEWSHLLAATGVGLVVELSAGAALATGAIAVGAGLGATALDYGPCTSGEDQLACGGLIMGGAALGYGGAGFAIDTWGSFEGSEFAAQALNLQSVLIGGTGLLFDGYSAYQQDSVAPNASC